MIKFSLSGSTSNTDAFLKKVQSPDVYSAATRAAEQGVSALRASTPVDSGLTANSWSYEITTSNGKTTISWLNSHTENGVNIAIILQYGHGTGTGGYVAGYDYINPAMRPVFDAIAEDVWRKVTTA